MGSKSLYTFIGQDKVTPELKKIQGSLQKFNQTTKSMADGLKNMGKAMAGAFAFDKLKDGAVESFKAFADHEVVLRRFGEAVSRAGLNAEVQIKRFDDLGSSLERLMGEKADGDVILDLASKYIALGRTSEDVEKLIRVSADLAALTGGDVSSSMEMLTKADSGNVKALKILLPELKNLTEAQIANGEAVDLVASKVTGMSEKIYGGAKGSINALGESFETLHENIGDFLSGAGGLVEWTTNLTKGLNDIIVSMNKINAGKAEVNVNAPLVDQAKQLQAKLDAGREILKKGYVAQNEIGTVRDIMGIGTWELGPIDLSGDFKTYIERQLPNQMRAVQEKIAQLPKPKVEIIPQVQTAPSSAPKGPTAEDKLNDWLELEKKALALLADVSAQEEEWSLEAKERELENLTELQDAKIKASEELIKQADEALKQQKEAMGESWNSFNVGIDALVSFYSMWSDLAEEQAKAEIDRMKKEQDEAKTTYELQRNLKESLGEDTTAIDEEYANQYLEAQRKIADKERDMKKKAWESNRAIQLTNSIMGGANAVINALATAPPPWSFINAGIVGSLAAAQTGLILSQPMPSFAVGTADVPYDMTAQIHQGEMIVSKPFAQSIRDGEIGLSGSRAVVNINVSGQVYGSLEQMTREVNRTLTQLKREGKI